MKKLNSIEYLKTFSILYIVGFWHLSDYTNYLSITKNPFLSDLTLTVLGLFVFISGFLLGKTNKQPINFLPFLKKRLLRIYPLYALAVIVFYFFDINNALISIKSLFFISMFSGPAPFTLWFITMIMFFYVLTPFLVNAVKNKKKYFLFILLCSIVTFILIVFYKNIDYRLAFYFPLFCLGIYCSNYGVRDRYVNFNLAMVLLLFGLLLKQIEINSWLITQFFKLPIVLSCSYIIFYFSIINECKFKSLGIISIISYSSFSMYLFHRPIYSSLIEFYFPKQEELQFLYLIFGCFLVLIVSWGIQKTYDHICLK